MTRYIDADALIDTLYEHEFSSYIDKGAVSTLINDEPTVDAVPIEFIRERMDGYYKNSYTELCACLETLIEDWRKEHDTADKCADIEGRPIEQLIRCKECDNWDCNNVGGASAPCYEWSDLEDGIIKYTDAYEFCSRAERKEE